MFPSLPSNGLVARFAPEAATNTTPKATAETSGAPKNKYLRLLPRRNFLSALILFPAPPIPLRGGAQSTLLAQPPDSWNEVKNASFDCEPSDGLVAAVLPA